MSQIKPLLFIVWWCHLYGKILCEVKGVLCGSRLVCNSKIIPQVYIVIVKILREIKGHS